MDALGGESSRSHTRHELEDEIERVAREREVEGAVDFYTSNRNETLTDPAPEWVPDLSRVVWKSIYQLFVMT